MFYNQSIVQFIARRSHLILAQIFLLTLLFLSTGKNVDASPYPYLHAVPLNQPDIPPSPVWGTVWNDLNNNGNRERFEGIPEPLLAGAEVRLQNVYSGEEWTEQTNRDGEYYFQVHRGIYVLEIEALGGIPREDFPAQVQPVITRTAQFTVQVESNVYIDPIGLQIFSALGGRIWNDENFDGMQSDDEAGLPDISVELVLGDSVTQTVQSDADGNYLFQNLPPAAYAIQIVKPEQYRYSPQGSAIDDEHNSDLNPALGQTDMISDLYNFSIDIGLNTRPPEPAYINGTLWEDLNGDGIRDDEPPLSEVEVGLWQGDERIDTMVTGVDGSYEFSLTLSEMVSETYQIKIDDETLYQFDPQNQSHNLQPGMSTTVTLAAGQSATIDSGLYRLARLGNQVWSDLNQNGVQDNDESGIAGVKIQLADGSDQTIEKTTTGKGRYQFKDLRPGLYHIIVEKPEGYEFSPQNPAIRDDLDSDVDPATGESAPISLSSGEKNNSVDVGLYLMATPTPSPEYTATPTITATSTVTATPTLDYTETPTPTITATSTVTTTPTLAYTETPTLTVTSTPVVTVTSTVVPTATPTPVVAKISGAVWVDQNRNGLWDGDLEELKHDIWISLYLEDQPNSAVYSTTTAASGSYIFTNLQPGNYYMQVGVPTGYELTSPHRAGGIGSRFELDGSTNVITVTAGAVESGWNVGLMEILPDMVPQITRVDYVTETEPITVCGTGFLTDGGLKPMVIVRLEELIIALSDSTATVENIYEDGDVTCLEVRLLENLPAGYYTVIVKNANGEMGMDQYAFTVLPTNDTRRPIVTKIIPNQHRAHQTSTIQFHGLLFQENITLGIGGIFLTPTVRTGETYLEFVIDANRLPPGLYDLILENPDEIPTSLPDAYTILKPYPIISSFRPDKIYQNSETVIDIFGDSFSRDMTFYLQNEEISQTLPITYFNNAHIQAAFSESMPTGDYGFALVGANGSTNGADGHMITIYDDAPQIFKIWPDYGHSDAHNQAYLYGKNLITGTQVSIGEYTVLDIDYVSDDRLEINIPSNSLQPRPERYDIQVTNPNTGKSSLLPDAYIALVGQTKDVYSRENDLWSQPHVPHVNEQVQVGLNVHLQGSQQRLSDVKVTFLINSTTGQTTFTREANIANLNPSGSGRAMIHWTPPTDGDYTVIATIDPENLIEEEMESNNVVTRTFIVLPQGPDMVSPRVDEVMINDSAEMQSITEPEITIQISASDTIVQESQAITSENGISSIYVQELKYNTSIRNWVPIDDFDWKDYQHAMIMDWKLDDSSGLKAIQVWASDWAGNISLFPSQRIINYEPPTSRVKRNGSHMYSHEFAKDECVRVEMTTVFGDPDIYVWPPAESMAPAWVNNIKDDAPSKIVFIAPIGGSYQVEVHGYEDSTYGLNVTHEFEGGGCTTIQNKNDDRSALAAPASLELSSSISVPPPPIGPRTPERTPEPTPSPTLSPTPRPNNFDLFLPVLKNE